jgi:hypothetical protein
MSALASLFSIDSGKSIRMAIFIDSSFNEMRTMESLGWYPIRNGTAANKSLGVVTVVMGEALAST